MTTEYVTLSEIEHQPTAIGTVIDELIGRENDILELISPGSTFCFIGCGTSYYLSLIAQGLFNESATSFAFPGGDVLISPNQVPDSGIDVIAPVSRSGESTETVQATEELQDRFPDAVTLGITCTEDSPVEDISDVTIVSRDGQEEGLAMTKSFSSMLAAVEYLARLNSGESHLSEEFDHLSAASEAVVERSKSVSKELGENDQFDRLMFLGSGELYGIAAEAMLKLEEMSLSWTKAYHTMEFRHGPRSIADENTLVTVFVPNRKLETHNSLIEDVRELGAKTLIVGSQEALEQVEGDYQVILPGQNRPPLCLYAPIFQLLGFYSAISKGLNPDSPENLTQVVKL